MCFVVKIEKNNLGMIRFEVSAGGVFGYKKNGIYVCSDRILNFPRIPGIEFL